MHTVRPWKCHAHQRPPRLSLMIPSASYLAEISVSSPRKLLVFIIQKCLFWIKVSKKQYIYFEKGSTDDSPPVAHHKCLPPSGCIGNHWWALQPLKFTDINSLGSLRKQSFNPDYVVPTHSCIKCMDAWQHTQCISRNTIRDMASTQAKHVLGYNQCFCFQN